MDVDIETALGLLVTHLTEVLGPHLRGFVLFGGAARVDGFIPGWSDIDAIIIISDTIHLQKMKLREFLANTTRLTNVRFDVAILRDAEYQGRFQYVSPFNCMMLNALSGRPDCARVISGEVRFAEPTPEVESANVRSYLHHYSIWQIRHLLVAPTLGSNKDRLAQMIRWTSSYLRAWLRLHRVFTLPYQPTIDAVHKLIPSLTFDEIEEIFARRQQWAQIGEGEARESLEALDIAFERAINACSATLIL